MWIPPATAEALEGAVQPRAAGPRVHGADANCRLSRHVCIFKAKKKAEHNTDALLSLRAVTHQTSGHRA